MTKRTATQLGFLLATLVGVFVVRGNAERWCPFGGVEALYTYVVEGSMLCSIAVSNLFVLAGVILTALLLRRAFCGYVCPLGTIGELMRGAGRRLGLPKMEVGRRVDAALSLLKYGVLLLFVALAWQAGELVFRGYCPAYALLGRHGEDILVWAYVVLGFLLVASLFVSLPFCRWLCPLGAFLNIFSRFGAGRIVRDTGACVDCGKCARACPMGIPVHDLEEVTAARCTSCMECVSSCPTRGRRTLAWRMPGGSARVLPQGAVIALLLVLLGGAVVASVLNPLPSFTWTRGDPSDGAAVLDLDVEDLSCRGKASLFVYFLDRDDDLEIGGPLLVEAWPEPGRARARITYDPAATDAATIRAAVVEPYYDYDTGMWRMSPFGLEGYDPFALPDEASAR